MKIAPFLQEMNKYPSGTILTLLWKNGLKIEGEIDTFSETLRYLDEDEEEYEEYFAAFIMVRSIEGKPYDKWTKIGELMEISHLHPPSKISLQSGKVIWSSD
jgi:hypothetical protein